MLVPPYGSFQNFRRLPVFVQKGVPPRTERVVKIQSISSHRTWKETLSTQICVTLDDTRIGLAMNEENLARKIQDSRLTEVWMFDYCDKIRYDNFIYTRYFHQLIKLIIYSNVSIYLTIITIIKFINNNWNPPPLILYKNSCQSQLQCHALAKNLERNTQLHTM